MPIVSVSMDDSILRSLDDVAQRRKYRSRSEAVREALRELIDVTEWGRGGGEASVSQALVDENGKQRRDAAGHPPSSGRGRYSTVTLFARFRGLSIGQSRNRAAAYAKSCSATLTGTGEKIHGIEGISITSSTNFRSSLSPSVPIARTGDPRALTSPMLERIFSYVGSWTATATTGVGEVRSASGPCFSSPAAYASAWIYEISLIFNAPSMATG